MTALIIGTGVLVIIFLFLVFVMMQAEEWAKIPLFAKNSVGGEIAICPITSYKAAKKNGTYIGGKVLVPETIVLRKFDKAYGEHANLFSGLTYDEGYFGPYTRAADLFVPFTSPGLMSFEQQETFFIKPQNPEIFATESRRLMCQNDWWLRWRLRAVEWESKHNKLTVGLILGILALIFCLLVVLVFNAYSHVATTHEEEVAVYTTGEGGFVHKTEMKRGAPTTLLLPGTATSQPEPLIQGKVVRVEPPTAGVNYTCVRPSGGEKNKDYCGFASPTVKIGDEMFLRSAVVQMWASINRSIAFNSPANVLLTKPEADALVKTREFRITDAPD